MKKLFITLMLMLTMMFCMTSNVSAETYSGNCGYDLKWTMNTDTGVLHIFGTGDMIDYSQSGAPWYSYRDSITSVVVDNGCTHIGSWAFGFLQKLTTANLPNSVTTLGHNAFRNCSKLVSCPLPDYLTTIKEDAFWACSNLYKVTFANNTRIIGHTAFGYCNSLRSVKLPASVEELKFCAFYWHKNSGYPVLEQVVIMNPNCKINDYAYLGRPGVCTIYGEKGSTAHTYAITQGYNFDTLGNEKPEPSIFKDVRSDAYYAAPIEWAVNNGITAGITPTTFEPETAVPEVRLYASYTVPIIKL